jgi:hypothetical protein
MYPGKVAESELLPPSVLSLLALSLLEQALIAMATHAKKKTFNHPDNTRATI